MDGIHGIIGEILAEKGLERQVKLATEDNETFKLVQEDV